MNGDSAIVTARDFDLSGVESGDGWWIAAGRGPDWHFAGEIGRAGWEGRLRAWLAAETEEPPMARALEGFDQRAAALSEAALSFRHYALQRLAQNRPWPATDLTPENLVDGLEHFLERCGGQFPRLKALIPEPSKTGGLTALARDTVLLIIPANVVVAGMDAIQQALLAGCRRVVVRLPRVGASVIVDYCRWIARTSPDLGGRLILARWPADAPWPDTLRQIPPIAFGGESSLATIAGAAGAGMAGIHGHQVGVAIALGPPTPLDVAGLAGSTIVHEQRGCLSPRLFLVADCPGQALPEIARALAAALDPGTPTAATLAEQAAIARRRDQIRLSRARAHPANASHGPGLEVSTAGNASVEWHQLPADDFENSSHTLFPPEVKPAISSAIESIRQGVRAAQARHIVLVGLQAPRHPANTARVCARALAIILQGQPISNLGAAANAQSLARQIASLWPTLSPAHRPIPRLCQIHAMQQPDLTNPLDARPPLWDFLQFTIDAI